MTTKRKVSKPDLDGWSFHGWTEMIAKSWKVRIVDNDSGAKEIEAYVDEKEYEQAVSRILREGIKEYLSDCFVAIDSDGFLMMLDGEPVVHFPFEDIWMRMSKPTIRKLIERLHVLEAGYLEEDDEDPNLGPL